MNSTFFPQLENRAGIAIFNPTVTFLRRDSSS